MEIVGRDTWNKRISGGEQGMDRKREGMVTRNLISLELQLKTLFEDCGGEGSLELLDRLSKLSRREQEVALKLFASICDKVASNETPVLSANEEELQKFEEDLYESILAEIHDIPSRIKKQSRRFEVVDGGKTDNSKIVELAELRRSRSKVIPQETA